MPIQASFSPLSETIAQGTYWSSQNQRVSTMWTAMFFFFFTIFLEVGGAEGNYRLMDYAGSKGKLKKTRGLLHVCSVKKKKKHLDGALLVKLQIKTIVI